MSDKMCIVCKVRPRAHTKAGTQMSICCGDDCALTAMKRLDAAGVIPDEMAKMFGLRDDKENNDA